MADDAAVHPVSGDEVSKVDDAIAVGEDLAFQERWWSFERFAWTFFTLLLLADVLGVFGNGWLSRATIRQPGTGMHVDYERVERTGSPSKLTVQFGPDAVQDGQVKLLVSGSVVGGLGAQRVIPEPEQSALSAEGMLYTFPAVGRPGEVAFELEPSAPGLHRFFLQVPGRERVSARVLVMP